MKHNFTFLTIAFFLFASLLSAQLRPAKIFSEHMVLQRDVPLKIWGWAPKNEIVIVNLNGQIAKGKADEGGFWEVDFESQKAGGPYAISFSTAREKLEWKDIYFGDVWLCSGQSNMEWPVGMSNNSNEEIENANIPEIRHFKVPRSFSQKAEDDLEGGNWTACSPESVEHFTAVGYFFGKEIYENINVPIGLINSTWGGTKIEPWMSAKANRLENIDEFLLQDSLRRAKREAALLAKMNKRFGDVITAESPLKEQSVNWVTENDLSKNWASIKQPGHWEDLGYEGLDGVMWYKKNVKLNASDIQNIKKINLGQIDDSDQTWINGVLVGGMQFKYNVERLYDVPPGLLKPGNNVITIRIEDTGGGGGITADESKFGLWGEKLIAPLAGDWNIRLEAIYTDSNYSNNTIPSFLYNRMIYPLANFPIKGVIWYQGESNADGAGARMYRDQFRSLILEWRSLWQQEELPFYFVQLANWLAPDTEPQESYWAVLRESQTTALDLPATGMAVTIDIGDAMDIHPRNKQDVGHRLAIHALNNEYGMTQTVNGPQISMAEKKGSSVVISFKDNTTLVSDSPFDVPGFALCNAEGECKFVKGLIDKNQIVLEASLVPDPVEVRYAWGNNPKTDLYNESKLPALPRRIKITQ